MKIQNKIITIDHIDGLGKGKPSLDYSIGTKDGWEVIGPAHKRRYLSYQPTEGSTTSTAAAYAEVGQLLQQLKSELFTHPAFIKFLSYITTIDEIKGIRSEVRRFRPGFDYTVAHYGILTREPWLDINLCFVNDDKEIEEEILRQFKQGEGEGNGKKRKKEGKKAVLKSLKKKKASKPAARDEEEDNEQEEDNEDAQKAEDGYASDYGELWEDGDVGGFECFIEADNDADDAEAAEVYRQKKDDGEGGEDDTTLLSLSAYSNSLSLVLRDEGIMKFIKYVSANAPGSRWDINAEYKIEHNNDDDDDDEEEEGEDEEEEDDDEEDN